MRNLLPSQYFIGITNLLREKLGQIIYHPKLPHNFHRKIRENNAKSLAPAVFYRNYQSIARKTRSNYVSS
jgi:hypothetical protein